MGNKDSNVLKIDWAKTKTPIEISYNEYKNLGTKYLFFGQVEKMIELCKEHTTSYDYQQANTKDNSLTISIVGDRGSGKSSLMATTRNVIKENMDLKIYALEIIDPSVFDDSLSMIELVISVIYENTKTIYSKTSDNKDIREKEFRCLMSAIGNITKTIADLKSGKENFYRDNPNLEILSGISDRLNIKSKIKEIMESFLTFANKTGANEVCDRYKKIAIFIDDIDMVESNVIYEMLEDIRKYFSENAIVFLSYKQEELFSAILQNKIKQNELLIDNQLTNIDKISEKTARYIEKIVPSSLRIYLPSKNILCNSKFYDIIKIIDKGEDDRKANQQEIKKSINNLSNIDIDFKSAEAALRKIEQAYLALDINPLKQELPLNNEDTEFPVTQQQMTNEIKEYIICIISKIDVKENEKKKILSYLDKNNILDSIELMLKVSFEKHDEETKANGGLLKEINVEELIQKTIETIINEYNDEYEQLSVREWAEKKLLDKAKLNIIPVDDVEEVNNIFPKSLRGMLQLLEIIDGMEEIDYLPMETIINTNNVVLNLIDLKENYSFKDKQIKITQQLLKNIKIYENYLNDNVQEILAIDYLEVLNEWKNTSAVNKNRFICTSLSKKISNYVKNNDFDSYAKDRFKQLYIFEELQVYNVTLGDVYSLLEEFKKIKPSNNADLYFVYVMKVYYGIELLTNYLKAAEFHFEHEKILVNDENSYLESYLQLINCKIVPEQFSYYSRGINSDLEITFLKNKDIQELRKTEAMCLKIVYSEVAAISDIRNIFITQKKIEDGISSSNPLRYRNLYEYDLNVKNLISGDRYLVDPLSFLGQKKYVELSFGIMSYALISLFDIDIIMRINFGRFNDKNKSIKKLFNLLTGFLQKNDKVKGIPKLLVNKISDNVFINTYNTNLCYFTVDDEVVLSQMLNKTTIQLDEDLQFLMRQFIKNEGNESKAECSKLLKRLSSNLESIKNVQNERNTINAIVNELEKKNSKVSKLRKVKIISIFKKILADYDSNNEI